MPPAFRNHLVPTACGTPAPTAASSLAMPAAIAAQSCRRSSRPATGGRPGGDNGSAGEGDERAWRPSSSPRLNASTGSITGSCSSRSETSLPPRLKHATMQLLRHRRQPRDSNQPASGKPGAAQSLSRSLIKSHGSRLWAMMDDGPGATFAFSIPCTTET
jgi:hypothetical protein